MIIYFRPMTFIYFNHIINPWNLYKNPWSLFILYILNIYFQDS